jgi:hypothetical protein
MEAIGHIIELLTHLTLGTSQSIMANNGRGISLIIGLSSSTLLFHHILLAIFLKMNLIPSHHMYLSMRTRGSWTTFMKYQVMINSILKR